MYVLHGHAAGLLVHRHPRGRGALVPVSGGDPLAGVGVEPALVADLAEAALAAARGRSRTASPSARPIMYVERLEVVRVSNGDVSVSGSGTTTWPGSQASSRAPISCSDRRTPCPISHEALRTM